MPYEFKPPASEWRPDAWRLKPLLRFYTMYMGVTVVQYADGSFEQRQGGFTQDELAAAAQVWQGGHSYQVDDATGQALKAAGYTVFLLGYGSGDYGAGTYGTGGYFKP